MGKTYGGEQGNPPCYGGQNTRQEQIDFVKSDVLVSSMVTVTNELGTAGV
jgi:hypothetical protein